jgi:hypothetical protein
VTSDSSPGLTPLRDAFWSGCQPADELNLFHANQRYGTPLKCGGSVKADLAGYGRYGQAKNFALALLPSQPERATIATTLLADRIQQLRLQSLPG